MSELNANDFISSRLEPRQLDTSQRIFSSLEPLPTLEPPKSGTSKFPLSMGKKINNYHDYVIENLTSDVMRENGINTYTLSDGSEFRLDDRGTPILTDRNELAQSTKDDIRGGSFEDTQKEVDHKISIALGGTNSEGNLQALKDTKTISQTVFDFITGNKRLPSDYLSKNRQEGKMIVEQTAINLYKSDKITVFEAMAAIQNYDNKELVNSFLKTDFYDIPNKKENLSKVTNFVGDVAGRATGVTEAKKMATWLKERLSKTRRQGILNGLVGFLGGKHYRDKDDGLQFIQSARTAVDGEEIFFDIYGNEIPNVNNGAYIPSNNDLREQSKNLDKSIVKSEEDYKTRSETADSAGIVSEYLFNQSGLTGTQKAINSTVGLASRVLIGDPARWAINVGLEIIGSDAKFTPNTNLQQMFFGRYDFARVRQADDFYSDLEELVEGSLDEAGVKAYPSQIAGMTSIIGLGILLETPVVGTLLKKPAKVLLAETLTKALERELGYEISEQGIKLIEKESARIAEKTLTKEREKILKEFITNFKKMDLAEVTTGVKSLSPTEIVEDSLLKDVGKSVREAQRKKRELYDDILSNDKDVIEKIIKTDVEIEALTEETKQFSLYNELVEGIHNSGAVRKTGEISDILNEGVLLEKNRRFVAVPADKTEGFYKRGYRLVDYIDTMANAEGFESAGEFLDTIVSLDKRITEVKKGLTSKSRIHNYLLETNDEYAKAVEEIDQLKDLRSKYIDSLGGKEQVKMKKIIDREIEKSIKTIRKEELKQEKIIAKAKKKAEKKAIKAEKAAEKEAIKLKKAAKETAKKNSVKPKSKNVEAFIDRWEFEPERINWDEVDYYVADPIFKPITPERHIPKELTEAAKEFTGDYETSLEFVLGFRNAQETKIKYRVKALVDRLNAAKKLVEDDFKTIFNVIDNPKKYGKELNERIKKILGEDFLELHRKVQHFLTTEQVDKRVLNHLFNDDFYIRTIIETLDGGVPTYAQLMELKIDGGETFKDLLATHNGLSGIKFSSRNFDDVARDFATADLRDVYLKQFGLRTKRNYAVSMATKIRTVQTITANKVFNNTLRALSKEGVIVKEIFDPIALARTREILINGMRKDRAKILTDLKNDKTITDVIYNTLSRDTKDFADLEKEGLQGYKTIFNEEISKYFQGIKEELKQQKVILSKEATEAIDKVKKKYADELADTYNEIAREKGRLQDLGYKDAGKLVNELRGIMLNKKDYLGLEKLIEEIGVSSFEDFARTMKFFQATADLYQIPQAVRSSIGTNGFFSGIYQWLDAVSTHASGNLSVADLIEHSKYGQQGRHVDMTIDVWKKHMSDVSGEASYFMKMFDYTKGLSDRFKATKALTDFVETTINKLEKYQWETIMIPLKVNAWKKKVESLQKVFPNKSIREIKIEAGRAVDDYFQGQDWNKLLVRNPKLASKRNQRNARIFIFALDATTSYVRTAKRDVIDIFKGGIKGDIARKKVIRSTAYGLGLAQVISYALNGHSTFENEDPNSWYRIELPFLDEKGNHYYLDTLGNWRQTYALINSPRTFFANKVSGLGRTALNMGSDRGLDLSGFNPVPFNMRSTITRVARDIVSSTKKEFGVPEDMDTALKIQLLEFFGFSGTFSSGKSKTATAAKVAKELLSGDWEAFEKNLVHWGLGQPIETETEIFRSLLKKEKWGDIEDRMEVGETEVKSAQTAIRELLEIEGSIKDNYSKIDGKAGEILISSYSESVQNDYLLWKTSNELYNLSLKDKGKANEEWSSFVKEHPDMKDKLNSRIKDLSTGITEDEKDIRNLGIKNGKRIEAIIEEFKKLDTNKERDTLWNEYKDKGIITKSVIEPLLEAIKKEEDL